MEREPTNRRCCCGRSSAAWRLWGLLLGLGSYLGLDPETPDRDVRRLLIVGGSVGVFLAFWLAACCGCAAGGRRALARCRQRTSPAARMAAKSPLALHLSPLAALVN